jgi:hypothetical protein
MNGEPSTRNISPIRTFAQDAALMKGHKDRALKTEEKAVAVAAVEAPTPEVITQAPAPAPRVPVQKQVYEAPLVQHVAPDKQIDLTDEVSQINTQRKTSILSDSHEGFDEDRVRASGTIIRDTKRKRFRLLPAMIEAATGWFTHQKENLQTKKVPQHTVSTAESRKEIIEAAVQHGVQAPKEDFGVVAQRLKAVPRTTAASSLTFKEKEATPAPSWSYVEEQDQAAPIEDVPRVTPEPEVVAEQTQTVEEEVAVQTTVPAPGIQEASQPLIPPVQQEEIPTYTPPPQEMASDPLPAAASVPAAPATLQTAPTSVEPASHTKRPVIIAILLIMAGAILLGIGLSFYFFGPKEEEGQKVVVYKIPSLIRASRQEPIAFFGDRVRFLENIKQLISGNNTVIQLYPATIQQDGSQKPGSIEEILAEFNFRAPGSFVRSVKEIALGGAGNQPYLVLEMTNFDVAFAGMLEWEQTMSADLSPLFGPTVIETFDPSARTATQVRNAFFTDAVASNKNVRILFDETGSDRIVYTFTDQDTILITTTRESLELLLPLVK